MLSSGNIRANILCQYESTIKEDIFLVTLCKYSFRFLNRLNHTKNVQIQIFIFCIRETEKKGKNSEKGRTFCEIVFNLSEKKTFPLNEMIIHNVDEVKMTKTSGIYSVLTLR